MAKKESRNCGNCLMEKVEIVPLKENGQCPKCGTEYGPLPIVELTIESVVPAEKIEKRTIESCRSPDRNCGLDESGAAQMASNVVRALDRVYTREQVHAIAHWIVYLSTQS